MYDSVQYDNLLRRLKRYYVYYIYKHLIAFGVSITRQNYFQTVISYETIISADQYICVTITILFLEALFI